MIQSPNDDENPVVCFCFNVTLQDVVTVIQTHDVKTVMDITNYCKAGNGCSSCWSLLEDILTLNYP